MPARGMPVAGGTVAMMKAACTQSTMPASRVTQPTVFSGLGAPSGASAPTPRNARPLTNTASPDTTKITVIGGTVSSLSWRGTIQRGREPVHHRRGRFQLVAATPSADGFARPAHQGNNCDTTEAVVRIASHATRTTVSVPDRPTAYGGRLALLRVDNGPPLTCAKGATDPRADDATSRAR